MAAIYNPGYSTWHAITPSDTANFDGTPAGSNCKPCDAIWVGVGGVVEAVAQNGAVTAFSCFVSTTDSGLLPIRAIRVNNTNTTATGLVALYESP